MAVIHANATAWQIMLSIRAVATRLQVARSAVEQKGTQPKKPTPGGMGFFGAPGRIRTSGRLIRSQVLYPAELLARGEGRTYGGFARLASPILILFQTSFSQAQYPEAAWSVQ